MSPLDSDTVDIIFARLSTVYGSRFLNQWPSGSLAEVKQSWSHELREFASNLDAIDYALDHLPSDHAPMVLEFRDIARTFRRVTEATQRRQVEAVSAEDRQRALDILKTFRRPERQDPKAWARKLRFRELAGERLTQFQRQCWREALANERDSSSATEARSTYDSDAESAHA